MRLKTKRTKTTQNRYQRNPPKNSVARKTPFHNLPQPYKMNGYEMISTPPKTTTSEEAPPTKIDVGETTQSSQEQSSQPEQQKEEINPDKTDDGSCLPTPDARQSPNFETSSEQTEMRTKTWKRLEELASDLGIEAGKTDGEEDEETEPRTKKIRSEYSPSRCSSREGKDDAETEKNPEAPELALPTRNNKLSPPEKEKKRKRKRTNRNAGKLRMPSRKYNDIGK